MNQSTTGPDPRHAAAVRAYPERAYNPTRPAFTPEEYDRAADAYLAGATWADAAATVRRADGQVMSKKTLHRFLQRNGLVQGRPPGEDAEGRAWAADRQRRAVRLARLRHSARQISELLDVSPRTVGRYLARARAGGPTTSRTETA